MTHVGVMHAAARVPDKRDLLLFDRVAVVALEKHLSSLSRAQLKIVETLLAENLVFEPDSVLSRIAARATPLMLADIDAAIAEHAVVTIIRHLISDASMLRFAREREAIKAVLSPFPVADLDRATGLVVTAIDAHITADNITPSRLVPLAEAFTAAARETQVRLVAQHLRSATALDAVAVLPAEPLALASMPVLKRASVVSVVLNALPVPEEATPWEKIVEFRRDDDAHAALQELRLWMINAATQARDSKDLAQELEVLTLRYERSMRIHRVKWRRARWETLVLVAADVAQNLSRFNFKDAFQALFAVRNRDIATLEAEQAAPGNQVAYIARAREEFRKPTGGA